MTVTNVNPVGFGPGAPAVASIQSEMEGIECTFQDLNYGATTGVKPRLSHATKWMRLVKNVSGGALTKGTAVRADWAGGDGMKQVLAACAAGEKADGVVDEYLAGTVANNYWFWMTVEGPCKVTTANATAIAAGDYIKTAASGQIVEDFNPSLDFTTFGRMLEATSASATLYRAYVNCRTTWGAGNTVSPIVSQTAATLTLTKLDHDGKIIVLDRAAGITVTLPAATGTGAIYRFFTKTTVTSNNHIIQVADATDTMDGTVWMAQDAADTVVAFEAAAADDTLTMNGSTKGGLIGDRIDLIDIATDVWSVQAWLQGTGTEATPFSAAV